MRIGIIITPERSKKKILKALVESNVEYEFIDLLEDKWYQHFKGQYDGYLIYPPSFPYEWKDLFFKRLYMVRDTIQDISTPSLDSILLYESKIMMNDFYKVNGIPHIPAYTFYNMQDALEYAHGCELPVVVKEDEGSGASGVEIIKERGRLIKQIKKSFLISTQIRSPYSLKTIKEKIHPLKTILKTKRNYIPLKVKRVGHIHIQEYRDIKYEWRIIRIGGSYFGHKKLEDDKGFHSGSLNKGWGPIPEKLLNLVKRISTNIGFDNASFDIFETREGYYYFNEIQVIFGTSTEEQLKVNGIPGRYKCFNGVWEFEEGDYSLNGCNNLKIKHLKDIL